MDEKKLISTTLRYGVIISATLVILGLIVFSVSSNTNNIYAYNTTKLSLTNLSNPLTITLYGIIILISLPVIIVGEQVILYSMERDKIYVGISLAVFLIMLFAILVLPKIIHI